MQRQPASGLIPAPRMALLSTKPDCIAAVPQQSHVRAWVRLFFPEPSQHAAVLQEAGFSDCKEACASRSPRRYRYPKSEVMMKAFVYRGVGLKAVEERPKPELQAPGDAMVRLTRTTICGGDLHILKGDVPTCA